MPDLHRHERYYWAPELTLYDSDEVPVVPQPSPAGGFEASFDKGSTWRPSQAHPDNPTWPCWLIQGPQAPAAPPGAIIDATITTKVKAAMAKEKPSTLAKVHVNSEKSGTVTLTGSAKTQADKDRAETVAKNVQGVTSVVNNIEVKP